MNSFRYVFISIFSESNTDFREVSFSQTLGKTEVVQKRESLEKMALLNPASFGSECKRECLCEVQGQHPCTALLHAPKVNTGKWRWNHNLI